MAEKFYSFIFALAVFVLAIAGDLFAQSESDAYRVETYSTSSSPSVEIRTSGGSIEVTGHSGNEVKIEMFVRSGRRYLSPSDTDLSDFDIEIGKEGDHIIATARKKGSGWGLFSSGRSESISFRVHAPEGATIDGNTSGGSVSAENFSNNIKLRTSGGSVSAKSIRGAADLQTSGGSITLDDISGTLSARTSGGSIRASSIIGEAELRTSGGSIRINDADAKLSARTSGGGIRAHFTTFNDDIELRTSGGSIQIDLPKTEHFNLDLSGGRVNTELRNFSGSSERNSIKGHIGNGGPTITARTSAGTIRLNY